MNNTRDHQKLVDDLLLEFGSRDDIRAWPRVVGVGRSMHDDDVVIRYGIVGESDIEMIWGPYGVTVSVEAKTGTGKLSEQQQRWRDMVIKFGGIHIEARSVKQAVEDFEKACIAWKERNGVL